MNASDRNQMIFACFAIAAVLMTAVMIGLGGWWYLLPLVVCISLMGSMVWTVIGRGQRGHR